MKVGLVPAFYIVALAPPSSLRYLTTIMFLHEFNIPESELSEQYRHIHHASLLRYLETARLRLLEEIGAPNQSLIDSGLFLVITRIEVGYKREVKSGSYSASCEDGNFRGKELVLRQRIFNERGKTCVEALVSCVFMDGASRRAILPPPDFIKQFESFWAES